jgi:hypothetical protein
MKLLDGRCTERPGLLVGDDLLDDRVAAVVGLGVEHRQRRVCEHPHVRSPSQGRIILHPLGN